ncbi:MAG: YkgJ family cysteine cluster protein [Candidatus Thiodiazotropha endolucinida]
MDGKCSRCLNSKCCTYTTEAIGVAPRSKADFEHLGPGGACGIYDQRPQICRDYDNDWCELDAPAENGFLLYFRNYAELLTYCKKRFKTWGR